MHRHDQGLVTRDMRGQTLRSLQEAGTCGKERDGENVLQGSEKGMREATATYGSFMNAFGGLGRGGDEVPIDGVGVTEVGVPLDPDGSPVNGSQLLQVQLGQGVHLVDDEGVVVEQLLTPDHGQIGKEATDGLQAGDPEDQQVLRDLDQVREGQVDEVRGQGVVKEDDFEESLNHTTVTQLVERRDRCTDVLGSANVFSGQHLCSHSRSGPSPSSPSPAAADPAAAVGQEGRDQQQQAGTTHDPCRPGGHRRSMCLRVNGGLAGLSHSLLLPLPLVEVVSGTRVAAAVAGMDKAVWQGECVDVSVTD